jgi:hypothetical protein
MKATTPTLSQPYERQIYKKNAPILLAFVLTVILAGSLAIRGKIGNALGTRTHSEERTLRNSTGVIPEDSINLKELHKLDEEMGGGVLDFAIDAIAEQRRHILNHIAAGDSTPQDIFKAVDLVRSSLALERIPYQRTVTTNKFKERRILEREMEVIKQNERTWALGNPSVKKEWLVFQK